MKVYVKTTEVPNIILTNDSITLDTKEGEVTVSRDGEAVFKVVKVSSEAEADRLIREGGI